jgi:hypothetical protein
MLSFLKKLQQTAALPSVRAKRCTYWANNAAQDDNTGIKQHADIAAERDISQSASE